MKTLFISIMTTVLLQTSLTHATAPENYEWALPINHTFIAGERGKIAIPTKVFSESQNFPNDLSIFDSSGTPWPFFHYHPQSKNYFNKFEPTILNRSFVTGTESFLQFELMMPEQAAPLVHNQLTLRTAGQDFVRRVEVFTLTPERALLSTGYLINHSRQQGTQNDIIYYPESDARRLYVRIYSNAQTTDTSIDLLSVRIMQQKTSYVDYETVEAKQIKTPKNEDIPEAQSYLFDLETINRPIDRICFTIENKEYARNVSILGRNTQKEPWRRISGGEIHTLKNSQKTSINLHARKRFLKVQVFNYDDAPLSINSIHVEAIPHYLIFEASKKGTATLYFRSWNAKKLRFDLKSRINQDSFNKIPTYLTTQAFPNQDSNQSSFWPKYAKLFGTLAVGFVSLLVIWVIISMLKKQNGLAD